eukprot:gene6270-7275_t
MPQQFHGNMAHAQHIHNHQLGNPPIPYPKASSHGIGLDTKFLTHSTPPISSPSSSSTPPIANTFHNQLHMHLENKLADFWRNSTTEIGNDFKTHDLPLARIKKIMKSDEEVNKISAEVPMLFSKACELFILEITHRSWVHTEMNKRRTLQRIDIANALSRSDTFDFLIDIVPREETRPSRKVLEENKASFYTPEYMHYIHLQQMAESSMKRSASMDISQSTSEEISPISSPKKRSLSHDFTVSDFAQQQLYTDQHVSYSLDSSHHHPSTHQQQQHNGGIQSLLNYSNQNIYNGGQPLPQQQQQDSDTSNSSAYHHAPSGSSANHGQSHFHQYYYHGADQHHE